MSTEKWEELQKYIPKGLMDGMAERMEPHVHYNLGVEALETITIDFLHNLRDIKFNIRHLPHLTKDYANFIQEFDAVLSKLKYFLKED